MTLANTQTAGYRKRTMTNITNNRTGFAGLAKAALTRPWTAACLQIVGTDAVAMRGTSMTGALHRASLAERWKV